MSSQFQQILTYLTKDEVREVILAVGRKVALRQDSGYFSLTPKPLTRDQLLALVRGTALAPLVERGTAAREPQMLELVGKAYRVQIGLHGEDLIIRIERPDEAGAPRAKSKTAAPRPKSKTAAPRPKGNTGAPRVKPPTPAPPPKPRSRQPSSITLDLEDDGDIGGLDTPATSARAHGGLAMADTIGVPGRGVAAPQEGIDAGPIWEVSELELDPADAAPVTNAASIAGLAKAAATLPAKAPRAPVLPGKAADVDGEAPTMQLPKIPAGGARGFTQLVREAVQKRASDLHIAAGRPIAVRVAGELVALSSGALPPEEAEQLLMPLLDAAAAERLQSSGYVDVAVESEAGGRLRANISRHQVGLKGSFRLARATPPTLEELGLPAALAKVVGHHQGLVVIAGPSGHGKTTTLAALVDLVNGSKPYHILTIEDPIEIVHPRKAAVVSQREVGRHTKSFASALKASLREDPDVIVIGELRDRESVEIALTAAETGHLVLATMSTPSAAKTLDRLIDMFPPDEHTQVRASIAGALRAIVAQRLVPAKQGGVVAAIELVTGVLPLATLIRDDKLYQLPSLMQRGRAFGMIRFDESLAELVKAGKVTEEAALPFAENKKLFARPA